MWRPTGSYRRLWVDSERMLAAGSWRKASWAFWLLLRPGSKSLLYMRVLLEH